MERNNASGNGTHSRITDLVPISRECPPVMLLQLGGLHHKRLLVLRRHFLPLVAQHSADFRVVLLGVLLGQPLALALGPEHERVHRPLDVRACPLRKDPVAVVSICVSVSR